MKDNTARKVTRRVALALIISLQLTHFTLQLLDRWGPPRKAMPKMMTGAKLSELKSISTTCFWITFHNLDVKLGKHLIQGLGIEALLWSLAIWSAACVIYDVGVTPDGLISLAQLIVVDVVGWTNIWSSAVGLVERKQGGYQVIDEEAGKVVDEKAREVVDEKMKV